jgi:rod shape-determining protein MreD
MTIDKLRLLLLFVVFVLAQVLVLNRIQLFHCATPLLYVYFIIMFPRGYPRWAILLWGFFMGITIDMFTNTPGVTSASLTLVAFIQPSLLELFLPRDAEENIKSSMKSLGVWNFTILSAILVLVHCMLFFALETFSFFNGFYWLQCAGASALLTFVLILVMDRLR